MLYLIATPIGHLEDITSRALKLLGSCTLILCEDTRHTQKLLTHYNLKAHTKSYHKFNEAQVEEEVIQRLQRGEELALVSDAGTPCIADPGQRLVSRCHEEGIQVSSIPGPCALLSALSLFGFESSHFQFLGFLPKKKEERKKLLIQVQSYPGTTVAYESPHRLVDTLEMLKKVLPQRSVGVARELTKKFEEVKRSTPEELFKHYSHSPPKGECVIGIAPCPKEEIFSHCSPMEHVKELCEMFDLPKKEGIKLVAQLRNSSKKELYQQFIT